MPRLKQVKMLSPEEEELLRKKKRLNTLENQLTELELDLHSLKADVPTFIEIVNASVKRKTLKRSLLRSRLTEALLSLEPSNRNFQCDAEKAREDAKKATQDHVALTNKLSLESIDAFESRRVMRASNRVKTLYQALVITDHSYLQPSECIHHFTLERPDGPWSLGTCVKCNIIGAWEHFPTPVSSVERSINKQEFLESRGVTCWISTMRRERHTEFMQEVHAAYEDGDYSSLIALHEERDPSIGWIRGVDVGDELVSVIRRIYQTSQRIATVRAELSALKSKDDYETFSEAKGLGFRAYLNEVTAEDIDIPRLEEAIAALSGQIEEILDDHVLAQESRSHEEKLWEQITKRYN